MKEIIVERREGFKKTKLGWIPEDWQVKSIGDFYSFKNGLNKGKEYFGKGTAIINYKDVYKNQFLTNENINGLVEVNKSEKERYSTKRGDVFFTRTSETVEEIAFAAVLSEDIANGVFSGFVLRARPVNDKNVYPEFAAYCFNTFQSRKEIIRKSTMTTRALTNGTFLSQVDIAFPPLPEQKAIANCLSTWDTAITKLDALIKAKQQLKKGLMQQLLSGKKRLPDFDGEWSSWTFEELFKKVSRPVDWDDEETYELISVRRRSGGLFHRDSLKGYEILTKKLYTAKKGDFLMSKMQILHGASGIVTDEFDNMKISGSYIAVVPKNDGILNMEYMAWYSQTPFFYHQTYRSSYGVHIEKMTFNYNLFKKEEVLIPSVEEQTAIAQVLNTADQEIALLTTQRNLLQLQKKGLMQQLLTGKKRLRTNG